MTKFRLADEEASTTTLYQTMHVFIALNTISIAVHIKMKPAQSNYQVIECLLMYAFKTLFWLIGLDSIISKNSLRLLNILMEINWWTRVCATLNDQFTRIVMVLIPAVDLNKSNSRFEVKKIEQHLTLNKSKSTEQQFGRIQGRKSTEYWQISTQKSNGVGRNWWNSFKDMQSWQKTLTTEVKKGKWLPIAECKRQLFFLLMYS